MQVNNSNFAIAEAIYTFLTHTAGMKKVQRLQKVNQFCFNFPSLVDIESYIHNYSTFVAGKFAVCIFSSPVY